MITTNNIKVFVLLSLLYFVTDTITDIYILYNDYFLSIAFNIMTNMIVIVVGIMIYLQGSIHSFRLTLCAGPITYIYGTLICIVLVGIDIFKNGLCNNSLYLAIVIVKIVCKSVYSIIYKYVDHRVAITTNDDSI